MTPPPWNWSVSHVLCFTLVICVYVCAILFSSNPESCVTLISEMRDSLILIRLLKLNSVSKQSIIPTWKVIKPRLREYMWLAESELVQTRGNFASLSRPGNRLDWEFPGCPVVWTQNFHCHDPGSIPGWGTKAPQTVGCGQKEKREIDQTAVNHREIIISDLSLLPRHFHLVVLREKSV